jgi:hypothetical protein
MLGMGDKLTRDELVERLAEVSHQSWMEQKEEDLRRELDSLPTKTAVTDHDRRRAEDTVRELEQLGIWPR